MTAGVCQRRWTLLRENFKARYFDQSITDDKKDEMTPKIFYCKLKNLYENYVKNKVNETMTSEEFGNKTIDMHSSMVSILNNEPDIIKVLRTSNDNAPQNSKTSQSKIIIRQIKALPKDEVYIERFKTRIDPNTPFNKRYSYQTQPQSQKSFTRTKLQMDNEEPKKSIKKPQDLTIIYPTSFKTNVLETCDLSHIDHGELSSCYIDNPTKSLNIPIDLEFSSSSVEDPTKYSDYQYLDNTTIDVAAVNLSNKVDENVEIPSKKLKIERHSLNLPSTSRSLYNDQQMKTLSGNHVIVRKIVKNVPIFPKPAPETPASDWTIKFMLRYEADMRNLNAKVDRILRQVSQNTRKVTLKRDASEDIY